MLLSVADAITMVEVIRYSSLKPSLWVYSSTYLSIDRLCVMCVMTRLYRDVLSVEIREHLPDGTDTHTFDCVSFTPIGLWSYN